MLVLDKIGNIFDERRKSERRKNKDGNEILERRIKERRVEDLNKIKER